MKKEDKLALKYSNLLTHNLEMEQGWAAARSKIEELKKNAQDKIDRLEAWFRKDTGQEYSIPRIRRVLNGEEELNG